MQDIIAEKKTRNTVKNKYFNEDFLLRVLILRNNCNQHLIGGASKGADAEVKRQLLSSTFPEKVYFSKSESQTPEINEAVRLILNTSKGLSKKKPDNCFKIYNCPVLWRRPESNRCPNIFAESFLHVYFSINCRKITGTKQTNYLLS